MTRDADAPTKLSPVPAAPDGAGGRLAVRVLTSMEALEAAGPAWQALEARAAPSTLFQSHAQTMIWARNYLVADDAALHIAMVYAGDTLHLILPLCLTSSLGIRIARVTGYPIAQYSDAVSDGQLDDAACFAAILKSLHTAKVDELSLEGIREGSTLHRFAISRSLAPASPRAAPFVDLTRFADHDSFVRERSKGFGKKMRARRRQLEQQGELRFEILEGGKPARQAMADAVNLKREWLIQRGAMSTAFIDPVSNACLLDLAENAPGAVVILMLLNGTTAAIRLGFEHRGTFFSYLSAYEETLAQYSPGKLLMDFTLSSVRDRGTGTVDMFPPSSENKSVWCDRDVAVADYIMPLTVKGWVHAGLYRQKLRPLLRSAYYRLPNSLRSLVARKVLSA